MSFITLLFVTFAISLATSLAVSQLFRRSVNGILVRILDADVGLAWAQYIRFAIVVTGVGSGVNLYKVEQYITAQFAEERLVELTPAHWVLECYRSLIGTLQGITWMLLVFFVFTLIAFVIVRVFELRQRPTAPRAVIPPADPAP